MCFSSHTLKILLVLVTEKTERVGQRNVSRGVVHAISRSGYVPSELVQV